MEKAVFITKVNQLKYINNKYARVYFGNEFCERLIPSLNKLKQVFFYIKNKNLNFSLVTPYVTNHGLRKVEVLFKFLKQEGIGCEIIINDWGVLNLINRQYSDLIPVLGRLLTKQQKGPGLAKLLERKTKVWLSKSHRDSKVKNFFFKIKFPIDLVPYYKGTSISSVPIYNFLINRGVKRIELDNTVQGLSLDVLRDKISASVYFPYVYITTTFFCPTAGCDQKKKSPLKIKPCQRQCQKYVFKLRHRTMPKVIYLKGNTQFYKNSKLSIKRIRSLGIDRIVYEPEIPV